MQARLIPQQNMKKEKEKPEYRQKCKRAAHTFKPALGMAGWEKCLWCEAARKKE